MSDRVAARRRIERVDPDGSRRQAFDTIAGEQPLEVLVDGDPVSVLMRTPGHDFELVLGFCLAEGIVEGADEVTEIRYRRDAHGEATYNVVDVLRRSSPATRPHAPVEPFRRVIVGTSACGVCGSTSLDDIRARARWVGEPASESIDHPVLAALPDALRRQQRIFDRTGGVHAAGLATTSGELRCVREDVGRHNAVDKVVGWAASSGLLPLADHVLVVSGRVAFEIVQKASVAGIPVVAAVSAPTGLAVELADRAGITIAGFVRNGGMNLYTHPGRVARPRGSGGSTSVTSRDHRAAGRPGGR